MNTHFNLAPEDQNPGRSRISDLVARGILTPGSELLWRGGGTSHVLTVTVDGTCVVASDGTAIDNLYDATAYLTDLVEAATHVLPDGRTLAETTFQAEFNALALQPLHPSDIRDTMVARFTGCDGAAQWRHILQADSGLPQQLIVSLSSTFAEAAARGWKRAVMFRLDAPHCQRVAETINNTDFTGMQLLPKDAMCAIGALVLAVPLAWHGRSGETADLALVTWKFLRINGDRMCVLEGYASGHPDSDNTSNGQPGPSPYPLHRCCVLPLDYALAPGNSEHTNTEQADMFGRHIVHDGGGSVLARMVRTVWDHPHWPQIVA